MCVKTHQFELRVAQHDAQATQPGVSGGPLDHAMIHGRHATPVSARGSGPLKRLRCPADLREVQFRLVSLAFAAVLAIAVSGQAGGIVKYRLPNGEIGYASPGLVPEGATVETSNYEPDGRLSRRPRSEGKFVPKKEKPAPPAKTATTPVEKATQEAKEVTRAKWAEKARAAQRELARAERNYETWKTSCRGVEESHSLEELPPGCSTYEKSRLDDATEKLEERRAWAEDGLFDACRTSGECLPGYIR